MREGFTSLANYQDQMSRLLLHATPVQDAATLSNLSGRQLADTARAAAGLAVYRNNVMYSLISALRAQFPATERLVGAGFFGALARDFIRQYPLHEPSLTFIGEELPAFIKAHPECAALPWLSDVARLEWICQHALHAAQAPSLQLQDLLLLPSEQLAETAFTLQPSVHLLSSAWPVQRIREEHLKPEPEQLSLDCDASTHLLIYRYNNEAHTVTLQAPIHSLLETLQQGLSLQHAWQQVQPRFALPDEELTPMLVYLLRLQIFQQ